MESTESLVKRAAVAQIRSYYFAIVAVLIAAGALSYTIQRDHRAAATPQIDSTHVASPPVTPPTNWWPVIIAGVVVLVAIGGMVVAGQLHLRAAQIAQQSPTQKAGPGFETPAAARLTVVADPAPVQHASADDHVFVTQTADELVAPFESGITDYAAKKQVEVYIGKWIRITEPIGDIARYSNSITVFIWLPRPLPLLQMSVLLDFALSEEERILHLGKGIILEAEGMITELKARHVQLKNCRVISVRKA